MVEREDIDRIALEQQLALAYELLYELSLLLEQLRWKIPAKRDNEKLVSVIQRQMHINDLDSIVLLKNNIPEDQITIKEFSNWQPYKDGKYHMVVDDNLIYPGKFVRPEQRTLEIDPKSYHYTLKFYMLLSFTKKLQTCVEENNLNDFKYFLKQSITRDTKIFNILNHQGSKVNKPYHTKTMKNIRKITKNYLQKQGDQRSLFLLEIQKIKNYLLNKLPSDKQNNLFRYANSTKYMQMRLNPGSIDYVSYSGYQRIKLSKKECHYMLKYFTLERLERDLRTSQYSEHFSKKQSFEDILASAFDPNNPEYADLHRHCGFIHCGEPKTIRKLRSAAKCVDFNRSNVLQLT